MKIQSITSENWKELRELYLKLLKIDPEAFADEYDEILSRSEQEWKSSLKKEGATFVAVENNEYIGMGRINIYAESPSVPVLHKLGVLPDYRGRGIARKLIEARENWAREYGAQKIRLYVFADREKTIAFSKKNGYEITKIQKDLFTRKDGTKETVVIMEKNLG